MSYSASLLARLQSAAAAAESADPVTAKLLGEIAQSDDMAPAAALMVKAILAAEYAEKTAKDAAAALREHLDRMDAEERLTGPDRAAASLACRAAVMAGDRLDAEQQRALLRALESCETPHTCPHGRPTMLHLSRDALDRSFGRK